jgi:adenosylmethionine-8-amino-7-oxononanoate aminotransferase
MHKNRLIEKVQDLSDYLQDRLKTLYAHKIVGDIRGLGFLWGIEFVKDKKTKEPFSANPGGSLAELIAKTAFKNGLIVYPGTGCVDGNLGDHTLIAPPFIIEKQEIDEMVSILDRSFSEVENEIL